MHAQKCTTSIATHAVRHYVLPSTSLDPNSLSCTRNIVTSIIARQTFNMIVTCAFLTRQEWITERYEDPRITRQHESSLTRSRESDASPPNQYHSSRTTSSEGGAVEDSSEDSKHYAHFCLVPSVHHDHATKVFVVDLPSLRWPAVLGRCLPSPPTDCTSRSG